MTEDQPDNVITLPNGATFRLGSLRKDSTGEHGIVELYGDLRRHSMGSGLAEGIDEVGTGASTFLTENLWGVGSTGPWMHDGRATTLTEAILEHGGEATTARVNFRSLSTSSRLDVLAFLNNLILFKLEEEKSRHDAGRVVARPVARMDRWEPDESSAPFFFAGFGICGTWPLHWQNRPAVGCHVIATRRSGSNQRHMN